MTRLCEQSVRPKHHGREGGTIRTSIWLSNVHLPDYLILWITVKHKGLNTVEHNSVIPALVLLQVCVNDVSQRQAKQTEGCLD